MQMLLQSLERLKPLPSTIQRRLQPPVNFFLLSNNASALQAVKNPRSIKAHGAAIRFHRALTLTHTTSFTDLNIPGLGPIRRHLPGLTLARTQPSSQLGTTTRWNGPHTISGIPEGSSKEERPLQIGNANSGLRDVSPNSNFDGQATQAKDTILTRTTSAALQLAVDHAFTGTYARRFRPADPPETTTCPCGARTRSPSHLIRECPRLLTTPHQCRHTHTQSHAHIGEAPFLHQTRASTLTFITEGKVAFRPPDFDITYPIPPEPD
jgi:hypothetical protein